MDSIIEHIENSPNKQKLFFYASIFFIVIALFNRVNIGLNIVLGLVIASILILYYANKERKNDIDKKELYEKKIKIIKPEIGNEIKKNNKFVDLIFSIQDVYKFNPPVYEDVLLSINDFLKLYDDVIINNQLAGENFKLMDTSKHKILNGMHSLIFKLPNNDVTQKIDNAIELITSYLNEHLEIIYDINYKNIVANGYNNKTVIIDLGPKANNFYENNNYDFY
jgi:hypothetical protein